MLKVLVGLCVALLVALGLPSESFARAGALLVEVGAEQAERVLSLFTEAGLTAEEDVMPRVLTDLAGIGRVVALKRNN